MKLLIVDDEKSALEAIEKNIHWDALPFDKVMYACSKAEALEKFAQEQIQVLLCDIEMPAGSGLELLEWVNENRHNVCGILMTCHADFSYAQQAVRLGGFDYILKPLHFDKLQEVLSKAAAHVEKQQELYQASLSWQENKKQVSELFWRALFVGEIELTSSGIRQYLTEKHLEINPEGRYLPLLVTPRLPNRRKERKLHDQALLSVLQEAEKSLKLKNTQDTVCILSDSTVLAVFSVDGVPADELLPVLTRRCQELIHRLEKVTQLTTCCYIGEVTGLTQVPDTIETLMEMDYANAANIPLQCQCDYHADNGLISPVAWICHEIQEHLDEELSVELLSDRIHLNVDYMNRLFKREMKISVSQYIIQQRIEKAIWYMKTTDESLGNIAAKVGYYNYSTFQRNFTNVTGKSPQKWKQDDMTGK